MLHSFCNMISQEIFVALLIGFVSFKEGSSFNNQLIPPRIVEVMQRIMEKFAISYLIVLTADPNCIIN